MTPDPLLRFVATPHQVSLSEFPYISITSNDEALARGLASLLEHAPQIVVALSISAIKLILDPQAPTGFGGIKLHRAGPVTMLLQGPGTILLHDVDTRELLAFLAPGITPAHLVRHLFPRIAHAVAELQTHDIDCIAQ